MRTWLGFVVVVEVVSFGLERDIVCGSEDAMRNEGFMGLVLKGCV